MIIVQEEVLKVIRYETKKEYYNHRQSMLSEGFGIMIEGWRYGYYAVVYKKYVV